MTMAPGNTTTTQGAHNISMGAVPHPIPVFKDKLEQRKWVLNHMAGVFRVFARKGFTEGSAGHISVRDPVHPNTFWINPLAVHFGMLKASDMIRVDEQGNVIESANPHAPPRAINRAGFMIHSAIHQARPDVNAACHTHSIYGKAYSAFGSCLRMINQDACTFYNAHDVYGDFGGVVLEHEEGLRIAEALGQNKAVILVNHGLLTVGSTVDEAGYLFTLMERSCEAQLLVDAARYHYTSPGEIPHEQAQYTFDQTSDPETLYQEFQPDLEYEVFMSRDKFMDL